MRASSPRQELHAALRELHAQAGRPSSRELAKAIGSVSHTTVAETLSGKRVSSWTVVQRIVGRLGGDEEVFRELWLAATETPAPAEQFSRSDRDFLTRYRRNVELQHGKVELPDFERRRRVPVTDLYVEPTLKLVTRGGTTSAGQPISLSEFDEAIGRTVLLGNPGSGKTAACNVLMYRHASDPDRPVPFLVTLRDFANAGTPTQSVIGYIEHLLVTFYQCPPPAGSLERLMLAGEALIVFDGLDELLDPALQEEVTSIIELFAADFPRSLVLVTSRVTGYGQAELDPRQFTIYQITEFGEEQLGEYVSKWFAQEDGITSEDAGRLADTFYAESSIAPELRANPLMLALMCIVYRGERSLPRNRVEVYEACTNLLLHRWDARRRIDLDLRVGHLLEPTLRHLAWQLFTRDPAHPAVTERELVIETKAFLRTRESELRIDTAEAASEFIEAARGRLDLFGNVGTNSTGEPLYAFTHRAFLEYFAAAHLAYTSDSPEQLARNLIPRLIRQEWEIVAELSVHIENRTIERGGERVFTCLLDHPWRPPRIGQVLSFLIRLLDSIDLPLDQVRALVGRVFEYARSDLSSPDAARPLARLLLCRQPMLDIVADELDIWTSTLIQSGEESDRLTGLRIAAVIPYLLRFDNTLPGVGIDDEDFWVAWSNSVLERYKDDVAPYLGPGGGLLAATWLGLTASQPADHRSTWHPYFVPRVRFDQLSAQDYENMVSVLLSREMQTHRVDGTGGDGGRDCYFSDEDGTDVYELKSFTGRLTQSRRQQVKHSLSRAMQLAPRSWTLVMPIDPTPAEKRWFDSLQAGVFARLEWKGKTWLEEKLAQHPDITRYFSGDADEVMRLLREINHENMLPHDARALGEQFRGAVSRLNEVDPYYNFVYTVTNDTITITAHPRYPDAPRDRPIKVSAILRFDDSPAPQELEGAFEDFMTFGTRVIIPDANVEGLVVDAPGGLGGEIPGGELTLDGTIQPTPESATAIILRVPPLPPIHHSLRLLIVDRSLGPEGGYRIVAQDSSGLLRLDLRVDPNRHSYRANLTYRYVPNAIPGDAVPVLRICAALANGEQMAFTDQSGKVLGTASGAFDTTDWSETYIQCAEKLANVQQLAGAYFPLPIAFSPEDQRDMEYASTLLSEKAVQAQWDGMITRLPLDTVRNLLEQIDTHGQPFAFASVQEETIEIAGGRIPLGWIQRYVPSAQLINLDEVRAWYEAGGDGTVDVRFQPIGNHEMTVRHIPASPHSSENSATSEGHAE